MIVIQYLIPTYGQTVKKYAFLVYLHRQSGNMIGYTVPHSRKQRKPSHYTVHYYRQDRYLVS